MKPEKFDPNHPTLTLASGRVVPLPRTVDAREFALPGNAMVLQDRLVAMYDESSSTGAIYVIETGQWTLRQPVSRGEFTDALAELTAAIAAQRSAARRARGSRPH